jgi:hypothetical protein
MCTGFTRISIKVSAGFMFAKNELSRYIKYRFFLTSSETVCSYIRTLLHEISTLEMKFFKVITNSHIWTLPHEISKVEMTFLKVITSQPHV